jgi:hypothetical protein
MNRPLILFHGDCCDGLGAAWAAWRSFKEGADYQAVFYGHPPPDVTGRTVYLLDFCYPPPLLRSMAAVANSITVLDHHVSARDALLKEDAALPTNLSCNFDLQCSGAALAWYHFHPKPLPWILSYVQDYDLWQHALPGSEAVNAYLHVIPKTVESFDHAYERGVDVAHDRGSTVLLVNTAVIEERLRHVRRINFFGYDVPIINHSRYAMSSLLHEMAEGEAFAVGYWQQQDGRYVYQLRSREQGTDVSRIAARCGGGGHKHAAGFTSKSAPESCCPARPERTFPSCVRSLAGYFNALWTKR